MEESFKALFENPDSRREREFPKYGMWKDLIETSGISDVHVQAIVGVLNRSDNASAFVFNLLDYVETVDATIFAFDNAEKQSQRLGIKNELTLNEESTRLYNLLRELRDDKNSNQ